jgi:hypothetical protein
MDQHLRTLNKSSLLGFSHEGLRSLIFFNQTQDDRSSYETQFIFPTRFYDAVSS